MPDAATPTPRAPPVPRGPRLGTSSNVKAELGATYRAFRTGEIGVQEARTRAYILQVLGSLMRDEKLMEIEATLEELKRQGVLS